MLDGIEVARVGYDFSRRGDLEAARRLLTDAVIAAETAYEVTASIDMELLDAPIVSVSGNPDAVADALSDIYGSFALPTKCLSGSTSVHQEALEPHGVRLKRTIILPSLFGHRVVDR